MAFKMPNGTTFDIETARGTATAFTGITNANPAVVTATGHGLETGDVVVITSGWSKLVNKGARVTVIDADSFSLTGVDTSNTDLYPAGMGAGRMEIVSGFLQIPQITTPTASGGEQQYATVGFLEDDNDIQVPTTKSAATLSLPVADDETQPYVSIVEAADQDKLPRLVRANLPNGSKIHYFGYVSITKTPTMTRNEIMMRTITVALLSEPTRFNPV